MKRPGCDDVDVAVAEVMSTLTDMSSVHAGLCRPTTLFTRLGSRVILAGNGYAQGLGVRVMGVHASGTYDACSIFDVRGIGVALGVDRDQASLAIISIHLARRGCPGLVDPLPVAAPPCIAAAS